MTMYNFFAVVEEEKAEKENKVLENKHIDFHQVLFFLRE